jgi:glyoxylate reductase
MILRTLGGLAMTARQRVVVACALPTAGLDLLRRRFVVEAGGRRPGRSWLQEHVPRARAILTDPGIRVDAELLDLAGGSLKVVANFAVGYDNIDLDAVRERGVRATNTPDVLTNATAELAITLMLAAARRITEADALTRSGQWPAEEQILGRELAGATVGLVGFGRIARRVAGLLRCFEVHLLFATRSDAPARAGADRREVDDLLATSDFVSLHVPLTTETRHLIDATRLAQMKRGAILVNTSRGGVVDTTALIDALRSRRLGAAGLDVYEDEPHVSPELRELPNTVLLPHLGSATGATRDAMARLCVENVIAVIEGREPLTPVV